MISKVFSKISAKSREDIIQLRNRAGLSQQTKEVDFNKQDYSLDYPKYLDEISKEIKPTQTRAERDELGREKKIGTWDLLGVNYLEKGAVVSKAVCKIHAIDDQGSLTGTGFLVSDSLLMTNHHNLETIEIAKTGSAEFDYELGIDNRPIGSQVFLLEPEEAYWIDEELDICIVAVKPVSQTGVALSKYGWLQLDPRVGKIVEEEFITVIHHPNGDYKQIAVRDNKLIKKEEQILWYASDTASGSSGAPCFSDRWQVVAVHRKGIAKTEEGNEDMVILRDGRSMSREDLRKNKIPESFIYWVANEGVRISTLIETLKEDKIVLTNPLISNLLKLVEPSDFAKNPIFRAVAGQGHAFIENRRPTGDYNRRNGYDNEFLGIELPIPTLATAKRRWGRTAFNSDTGNSEFPYYNFSIWMSRDRRMAFFAATNIDGAKHNMRDRDEFGNDKWVYDDRLPERLQIGNWFYSHEPSRYNKNYFDRGHIIRRTEPSWGALDSAQLANDDTFHWTNCSPQYKTFNQRSLYWQGIEKYLLENGVIRYRKKLTLYTGPIFSDSDVEHRSVLVPKKFFKIAVMLDENDQLKSAGYVLDQSEWVESIDFERARTLNVKSVRRSIRWIEKKTGINFGKDVREADEAFNLGDDLSEIRRLGDLFGR